MPNGYAIYGRDPVFADVDAHLAREAAEEAHAEHVSSCIDDAVDNMLAGPLAWSLLADVSVVGIGTEMGPLHGIYNRQTGECRATMQDDWMRVMLYAEAKHLPMLQTQWRDWVRKHAANLPEVMAEADKIAKQEADDNFEVPL